jgi:hypothetical protein
LLESIIEHDVTFVITILQAHIEDDWVRKIAFVSYTSKEELLPNGRRIDVFYRARNFKRICIGFEVKTGNEVDGEQLREELEGLKSIKECEESFLVLVAHEDPGYNIPYYFIPLSAFQQKINDVNKIVYRFVKEFGKKTERLKKRGV